MQNGRNRANALKWIISKLPTVQLRCTVIIPHIQLTACFVILPRGIVAYVVCYATIHFLLHLRAPPDWILKCNFLSLHKFIHYSSFHHHQIILSVHSGTLELDHIISRVCTCELFNDVKAPLQIAVDFSYSSSYIYHFLALMTIFYYLVTLSHNWSSGVATLNRLIRPDFELTVIFSESVAPDLLFLAEHMT